MLTLAIDTATKVCTVALCREQELLAEYTINMGMTHSEGLLPQLEQLLERCGVDKKEIWPAMVAGEVARPSAARAPRLRWSVSEARSHSQSSSSESGRPMHMGGGETVASGMVPPGVAAAARGAGPATAGRGRVWHHPWDQDSGGAAAWQDGGGRAPVRVTAAAAGRRRDLARGRLRLPALLPLLRI